MFANALVSVSNKEGLVDFLMPHVRSGMRVVSTGGTLKFLRENGIQAVDVSEQTGFPEVMDGRVKTLHPRIHMPILARAGNAVDMQLLKSEDLAPFDLVVVNLYPFAEAMNRGATGKDLIEYIDIGGPSLLRAAAKNFDRIAVVCDPRDYGWLAEKSELTFEDRKKLAARVFCHTSNYDDLIAKTMLSEDEPRLTAVGNLKTELRYGENPQQKAWWLADPLAKDGLHNATVVHGKQLSFNNLLDLNAAVSTLREFREPAVVAVKHGNPCGVGTASDIFTASMKALNSDPVSVFGGIVAVNRTVDLQMAEALGKIFLECIIAADFQDDALERLMKKKDLRLLKWAGLMAPDTGFDLRSVSGGYLVQTEDKLDLETTGWKATNQMPTGALLDDHRLAWSVCAHLKSNAIAIAGDGMTVGLGMGQVNRVDAVDQAISRWRKFHPRVKDVVLASDAFFPFPDSIDLAADAGIGWIIQPGGSIRDEEVFAKAKARGVNIVTTGCRHFRH